MALLYSDCGNFLLLFSFSTRIVRNRRFRKVFYNHHSKIGRMRTRKELCVPRAVIDHATKCDESCKPAYVCVHVFRGFYVE